MSPRQLNYDRRRRSRSRTQRRRRHCDSGDLLGAAAINRYTLQMEICTGQESHFLDESTQEISDKIIKMTTAVVSQRHRSAAGLPIRWEPARATTAARSGAQPRPRCKNSGWGSMQNAGSGMPARPENLPLWAGTVKSWPHRFYSTVFHRYTQIAGVLFYLYWASRLRSAAIEHGLLDQRTRAVLLASEPPSVQRPLIRQQSLSLRKRPSLAAAVPPRKLTTDAYRRHLSC